MADDNVFRLVMVGICVVFLPLGLYYRLRSYTGETIDRWQEGVVILVGLRLTAFAVIGAGVAWMINPSWMAWASLPIPAWLRWAGVLVAVCGGCLLVWSVSSLGSNLTDTVITREKHTLVQRGPYRWVRHPFYVAAALGLLGGSLVMANVFILLAGVVFWFAFLVPRTRIEEVHLIARFGDDYRDYMRRTGRFVPRLRS